MLQFYSASTNVVDSRKAITECLENALIDQPNLDCDLLIIYTAMGHNFKELLGEARRLCPSAQIVGCTVAGTIGREGPNESLKALAIMAIKGPKHEFVVTGSTAILNFEETDENESYQLGHNLAGSLKNKNPEINIIFLITSMLGGVLGESVIEGIESVFGRNVPIIGGISIDNKFITNFIFMEDESIERGTLMVGLADPTIELIARAKHGCEVIGDPVKVTRSKAMSLYELDGKPALNYYANKLGLPKENMLMGTLFSPFARKLPVELHDAYNSQYRIFGTIPAPDNGLYSSYYVPEGTEVWLTKRNEDLINEGVNRIMIEVLQACDGRKPIAVFHADCLARGKYFFNQVMKEEIIRHLQFPLCKGENIPWLGMYGSGEYTPLAGRNMMHTMTSSLHVLVRRKPDTKAEKVQLRPEVVKESKLFDVTQIRNITLKNRFVWSATWQGKANDDGSCSPELTSSILTVAKGETGLLITEMAYVSQDAISGPGQLGVYSDHLLPGLKLMAEYVHKAGASVLMQLQHGGLFVVPVFSGSDPYGPSPYNGADGRSGMEMSPEKIREIVNDFRDAAVRAQKAGFDGVQIHAAHGFLLSQFLSPYYNKRTDEYGGRIENRARIVLDIVRRIREATGDQFCIMVKINSDDFLPGGFNTDEMLEVSIMLEQAGVDAIELSGGTAGANYEGDVDRSFSPTSKKGIYYKEAAKRFKERIKIPLILVGGIRTFEDADELVREGITDYVSLCRPLIREPGLVKRWKTGDLRKSACISDSACLMAGFELKTVHCVHVKNQS